MLSLIIGGAGSGKSAFAEALVRKLPGKRIYLATMQCCDEESRVRIQRHRLQRAGGSFETVERFTGIGQAPIPNGANILLEDLSNLLANELYSPEGRGAEAVLPGICELCSRAEHLTVVTNEVVSGGSDYSGESLRYLRLLAGLNRSLAEEADLVAELVCGLPNVLKGELP